jgi:hypothetical protein
MNRHNLKQQISTPMSINNYFQIDHIWSNIFGVTNAYWPDYYKPIYCAFKLPDTLQRYLRQSCSFVLHSF